MTQTQIKTLADLLKQEARYVNNGFCYSNFPYPCMVDEAMTDARRFTAPPESRMTITRIDDEHKRESVIEIKPMPGSRKRKPITINLYWWK